MSDRYRECFLHVDADDRHEVLAALSRRLGVVPDRRTLTVPGFEVDVVGNDDRDAPSFLGWATKVEVYGQSATGPETVRFVTGLMEFLRSAGHRVVAVCDFEDELPQTDLD
ncbi:MAG TPA: hypothetical protein VLM05_00445 [Mycobacteriales bacterium]|nr:hypothetical protein [Mycobacteriales bacterium]